MADTTWSAGHIAGVVGGAVAGAVLLPAVAPVVLPIVGGAAVLGALGISVTAGGGALAGGILGHFWSKPSS